MKNRLLPVVVMTHTLPREWISSLEGYCQLYIGPVDATEMHKDLVDKLPQAEGIFSLLTIPITKSVLDQASKLRVVSNMAVGVDNIDVKACTERKIPVGNTPGVLTEATADLTMALLLSAARNLPGANLDARKGRWKTWSPTGWLGTELNGAALGIIGMGKIGKAVAKRALSFGMKIYYTDPEVHPEPGLKQVELEDLLKASDFVSLHAPLTDATRGIMNKTTLSMMKPTAILINAARGPLVDTTALVSALKEHKISAAALDVSDPEPLPPNHPLFSLPNCFIVPHIGSATNQTRRKMAELACHNLLAGLSGQPFPNCVNPEVFEK